MQDNLVDMVDDLPLWKQRQITKMTRRELIREDTRLREEATREMQGYFTPPEEEEDSQDHFLRRRRRKK